jgi:hypothetical protein
MMFLTPYLCKSFAMAIPAAPAHEITTFILSKSLLTNFKALISPANTTIAVQC